MESKSGGIAVIPEIRITNRLLVQGCSSRVRVLRLRRSVADHASIVVVAAADSEDDDRLRGTPGRARVAPT
jgi:hypothetical protein